MSVRHSAHAPVQPSQCCRTPAVGTQLLQPHYIRKPSDVNPVPGLVRKQLRAQQHHDVRTGISAHSVLICILRALTKSLLKPAAVHCVLLNLTRRRKDKQLENKPIDRTTKPLT
ncbi:hypothetical protein Ahy_B02g057637 isoform A [Arachis hypogaea]|uniref:Uncharacterized protein n=1 Tax=Arachis hypogaea TaxID=3818 RepID=A0A445ACG1_ARAHY|nr:hypothetical protein Ahy_B02g057637 isoform A [Arachis hypogaea]